MRSTPYIWPLAALGILAASVVLAIPGASDGEPAKQRDPWIRNDLAGALAQASKKDRPVLVLFR